MLKNKTASSSKSIYKQQPEWEISMIAILELNPWQFFKRMSGKIL